MKSGQIVVRAFFNKKNNQMKNLFFVFIAIVSISIFTACDNNKEEVSSDLVQIQEISNAINKEIVSPNELPVAIRSEVAESYFETYIDVAALVEGKGYEVILGNEDVIYTDLDGVELKSPEYRRGRPHRVGPCGMGHRISVDSLPQVIVDYIATNFPLAVIKKAKQKENRYLVLLNGHRILAFRLDGDLIEATFAFRHCAGWWGQPIEIDQLPEDVKIYLADNYASAEIKKAGEMRNGNIVIALLDNGERKILVFDENGVFLFERG